MQLVHVHVCIFLNIEFFYVVIKFCSFPRFSFTSDRRFQSPRINIFINIGITMKFSSQSALLCGLPSRPLILELERNNILLDYSITIHDTNLPFFLNLGCGHCGGSTKTMLLVLYGCFL